MAIRIDGYVGKIGAQPTFLSDLLTFGISACDRLEYWRTPTLYFRPGYPINKGHPVGYDADHRVAGVALSRTDPTSKVADPASSFRIPCLPFISVRRPRASSSGLPIPPLETKVRRLAWQSFAIAERVHDDWPARWSTSSPTSMRRLKTVVCGPRLLSCSCDGAHVPNSRRGVVVIRQTGSLTSNGRRR